MASVTAPTTAVAKRRTRRSGRTIAIASVLILIAGLSWYAWARAHATDGAADKLITATVTRGDLVENVSATGSVTSQTGAQVKIGSQITGVIKHLYADVGSQVKAGQLIAQLDLPDIEAQLNQAQATLSEAQTKLLQTQSGVGMEKTQTSQAIASARAALTMAQAHLTSLQASSSQQSAQTPTDIRRAQSALSVSQAALSTAQSSEKQVQASANLQIATAKNAVTQAQATSKNAAINLKRNQDLLAKGYVAGSIVDNAQEAATVAASQVSSAQENVQLVQEKVTADLQSAHDAVAQAQQNVGAAQAALDSANAETFSTSAKQADVADARAAVNQSKAALQTALGNSSQDVIKQQDVLQAREAVRVAQAQVDYNKAQLAKTYIRSPISGTVLQLASQQGETLAAGLSAPTLIIVADLNRLQVDAFVDETDIGKIRIGQDAAVTVDAFPKKQFTGKVTKIASGSTIQQGVVTYDVTVTLDKRPKRQPKPDANANAGAAKPDAGPGAAQSDANAAGVKPDMTAGGAGSGARGNAGKAGAGAGANVLKPDMTANVTIQTGKLSNVLLVPSVAVKVGTKGSTVGVVTKKGSTTAVDQVKVKTGGSDDSNTEIRDGLKEGDTIVLAGQIGGKAGSFGPSSPFGPTARPGGGGGGGGARRGN